MRNQRIPEWSSYRVDNFIIKRNPNQGKADNLIVDRPKDIKYIIKDKITI